MEGFFFSLSFFTTYKFLFLLFFLESIQAQLSVSKKTMENYF